MKPSCVAVPVAILSLAASPRAADLVVQPGNPSAYQTLQAALDAALPGDRILLAASLQETVVVIRKSVTIESLGPGRYQIVMSQVAGPPTAGIRIEGLSAGIPLTFRDVDIAFSELTGRPLGLFMAAPVPGEIRFDRVNLLRTAGGGQSIFGGGAIAQLATTVVWMRECSLLAYDVPDNNGCIDIDGTDGTDCLVVAADTLRLEDCTLRAGSANHLAYSCCFGTPPNCTGQFATGGSGGTALNATTRNSILVRCVLSDGNGGTVQPGPWLVQPSGGHAGASVLGGQSGHLDPFAVSWEHGLQGHVGDAFTGRGPTTVLGPAALLSIDGPVTPGSYIGVTLDTPPGSFSVFLAGLAWGDAPPFWVVPLSLLTHPGNGLTLTYPIPPEPVLAGVPIVLQGAQVFPTLELTNPSGVAIR